MRTTILALVTLVLACGLLAQHAAAAVFQYSVPVTYQKNTNKGMVEEKSTAFLWIPAQAKQVRGVIMGGMTLAERELVKDDTVRKACTDQQLALVFLKCGLGAPDLQKVLDDLAKVSGYKELSVAPLMFVGHSAGGPQARDMAVKYADRCFGLMQYRGGPPWDSAVPANIPSLMMVGQFDEFGGMMRNEEGVEHWEKTMAKMAEKRTEDPKRLWSMIVEPGAGHFSWSDRNATYFALFAAKAAAARIPATWPIDSTKPPALLEVDYQKGWLTGTQVRKDPIEAAAYADYKGDKGATNWHFDQELAQATLAYYKGGLNKKDQFIKWSDSYWIDAGARYFFNKVTWVGDGQTFEVHPVYADTYPKTIRGSDGRTQGPRWAMEGQPVGHSNAEILVKRVSGGVVPVGKNLLRMQFDNLTPAAEGGRVTFMAYSQGDDQYRYTEQVGMMPRGFPGLTSGKDQTLTFPPIGDLEAAGDPKALNATSDAGLKVEYYVAYGPATIEDGKLKIAELPARATFPIEVKVVAWQYGSGVAPLVKTAKPVEQTIRIVK